MVIETQNNGSGGVPTIGDIIGQRMGSQPNLFKDVITTSDKPEEYLAQAFLTNEDRARLLRQLQQLNMVKEGTYDADLLIWYYCAMSMGVDANARNHLTQLMSGGKGGFWPWQWGPVKKMWERGKRDPQPDMKQP